ncbi:universal stress protein [Haloarchaeobius amylolyticus]|uniref:universal stress protein n=1 Tax=Haloarchaeobius amylolyticus TaxID=1198296 RepID=UPI00226E03A0|nr:universal stress protein [Haloarchaeobius amylolyticus]
MYQRILVPTDGSAGAERATEYALELAERYDSAVHALFVVDTAVYDEPALSSTELVIDDLEDWGAELLNEMASRAHEAGLDFECKLCHGRPHEEILSYADVVDADLVVMGYQGQSHRKRIGSVADRVVTEADRPVLTV